MIYLNAKGAKLAKSAKGERTTAFFALFAAFANFAFQSACFHGKQDTRWSVPGQFLGQFDELAELLEADGVGDGVVRG